MGRGGFICVRQETFQFLTVYLFIYFGWSSSRSPRQPSIQNRLRIHKSAGFSLRLFLNVQSFILKPLERRRGRRRSRRIGRRRRRRVEGGEEGEWIGEGGEKWEEEGGGRRRRGRGGRRREGRRKKKKLFHCRLTVRRARTCHMQRNQSDLQSDLSVTFRVTFRVTLVWPSEWPSQPPPRGHIIGSTCETQRVCENRGMFIGRRRRWWSTLYLKKQEVVIIQPKNVSSLSLCTPPVDVTRLALKITTGLF